MTTLKSQMQNDLSTFLNQDEFSEEVNVNGIMMNVVVDGDELERRNLSKQNNTDTDRLSKSDVLFYVERTFFEHVPHANKFMSFNKKKYRIDTVAEQLGVLTIELSRLTG